ncbi:unnamed protein product [Paramecium sonneborni]|uniref:Uncharacterized protein n=1 Tax=Paramecium sonneborni TaxID=65129 RepID=A0A8S1MP30_9CILI|nr:unnamed protein product [Paramecium sonneborni]
MELLQHLIVLIEQSVYGMLKQDYKRQIGWSQQSNLLIILLTKLWISLFVY